MSQLPKKIDSNLIKATKKITYRYRIKLTHNKSNLTKTSDLITVGHNSYFLESA